jgi:hypothetical protein
LSKLSTDWLWSEITPEKVQGYLRKEGWEQVRHPNENLLVFKYTSSTAEKPHTLVVPAKVDLADFEQRIRDSVHIISDIEEKPIGLVLQRILRRYIDEIKARITDETHGTDTLPLDVAAKVIKKLRDFIGFAACSAADPKPFFVKATGIAGEFAQHCQFAHTFKGSFGFRVECPLSLPQQESLLPEVAEIPFERQVMERIAKSYAAINSASESKNSSPLSRYTKIMRHFLLPDPQPIVIG